jgi:tetratricopeptide (TPR) repeat protein
MRRPFLAIATAVLTLVATAPARAGDPAAALEQLKKGYELKTAGKCEEAIPHFVESHRLDPQAKTLLNLADCEERLGDLVSAQKHARDARQLAQDAGNTELLGIADERVSRSTRRCRD